MNVSGETTQRISRITIFTSYRMYLFIIILLSILLGILNIFIPVQYLLVGVFVIIAAILMSIYPFFGLLVYQFITVIQPGVIFPSLNVLHPERLVAIFLIASTIINVKLRRDKLIITDHPLTYILLLFVFSMAITVPTSYWPGESVSKIIDFLKTFAFFLLIIMSVKDEKKLKIFIWEYLLLVGYMAVSSIIAYKTGNVLEAQGIIRARGIASIHPNSLAATICLSLPFHILLFRFEKNRILKLCTVCLFPILVYAMILTGSRSGFLGLGAVIFITWFVLPHKGIRMLFLLAAAFLLIAIMPQQYKQRYSTIVSTEYDASTEGRFDAWEKGIQMFLDRPFTGVGFGVFGAAHAEGYSEGRKNYLESHSLYIQLVAEMGIIGLIVFALYTISMLKSQKKYRKYITRVYRKKTWEWALLMSLTISIYILFLLGAFGHNLMRSNWYIYGAITAATYFILGQKSQLLKFKGNKKDKLRMDV